MIASDPKQSFRFKQRMSAVGNRGVSTAWEAEGGGWDAMAGKPGIKGYSSNPDESNEADNSSAANR
jgi:hypothetical protein